MKTKHLSFNDIILTFPSYDDDYESWYTEHIWMHCKGRKVTYTICDSDGNHEPIGKRDVDKLSKDCENLWVQYSKWVIEHGGDDPCDEFMVKRERKMKRNYVGYFSHWIGEENHGLALRSVRWAKGVQDPQELPQGFQDYLGIKKVGNRWCMDGISVEVLKSADSIGYVGNDYFKGTAEWSEPIPEEKIRREVVKIAKRHLARKLAKAA